MNDEELHDVVIAALPAGLDLYDLHLGGGVLRVTVDRPGGVDLDTIAEATRQVSRALDRHDPVSGRYTLEVTSPGLERTLRTPAHFSRSVGERIRVKTRADSGQPRRLEGELVTADPDGFVVDVAEGDHAGRHQIAYEQLEQVRTVFEWGSKDRRAKRAAS